MALKASTDGFVMSDQDWTITRARAKFGELVEHAQKNGLQTIVRNGRGVAVVVSAEEWARKSRRPGNLAEFFAGSPLRGSKLGVQRAREGGRKLDL
jgi:prevent-host-death family protein